MPRQTLAEDRETVADAGVVDVGMKSGVATVIRTLQRLLGEKERKAGSSERSPW